MVLDMTYKEFMEHRKTKEYKAQLKSAVFHEKRIQVISKWPIRELDDFNIIDDRMMENCCVMGYTEVKQATIGSLLICQRSGSSFSWVLGSTTDLMSEQEARDKEQSQRLVLFVLIINWDMG